VSKLFIDISISLDGYVAGPNPTLDDPLGEGGEQLHEWVFPLKAWREPHGREGGEVTVESPMVEAQLARAGAEIMGRKKFSGGSGPWEQDPNADAWWGDNPPFHHPVFVLTHHAREPEVKEGGTTFYFVTDGIESALEQARKAAAGKDILIGGGAQTAQQYLRAGLVDEILLHVVPVLLGGGERLFNEHVTDVPAKLEVQGVIESPTGVMHLHFGV
jgi:dihydrofolate reductase